MARRLSLTSQFSNLSKPKLPKAAPEDLWFFYGFLVPALVLTVVLTLPKAHLGPQQELSTERKLMWETVYAN